MLMFEPQKLHPISYVEGLIEVIKQNIFVWIIFLLFNLKDFDFKDYTSYILPGIFGAFFLISLIANAVNVYNTRYWLENNHFIVRRGILSIERKELDIRRIQSIDTSQGVVQQLVGGVKLQVRTPSDGVDLSTVKKAQSDELEATIRSLQHELSSSNIATVDEGDSASSEQEALVNDSKKLYRLNFKELLFMALTSGSIGLAFITISPILGAVNQFIPWDKLGGEVVKQLHSISLAIIVFILTALLVSYIVGAVINIVRFYNYTVDERGRQLTIRYGLFNVKKITVPTERVQAVVEKQSHLRKWLGYTSLHFIITSDMEDADDEVSPDGYVPIFPFIKRDKGYHLIKELVPNMYFEEVDKGMSWRGFHRHFWIPALILFAIAGIVHYFWVPWGYLIAGVITLLLIIRGFVYTKTAGAKLVKDELAVCEAGLLRSKYSYFKHDKVLGMSTEQNPFLARSGLANFYFYIAKANDNEMIGLDYAQYERVQHYRQWYLGGEPRE